MQDTCRKRVAFVVVRYGKDINGGAELHCRMLAERLAVTCDVEVLTTCVKNYVTGGNEFEPGICVIDGVTVRRFLVAPVNDGRDERYFRHRSVYATLLRQGLSRLGLLKYVAKVFPMCSWGYDADIKALEHSVFYSPEMNDYIAAHKSDYDAIIAVTAEYAPSYFAVMNAGEKIVAIPTLHDTKVSYRPFMSQMFPKIKYTGFNTHAEWNLARSIFGKGLGPSGIISVGIETPEPAEWETVKSKFGLPDKYISYIGRIERGKIGNLLKYHKRFSEKYQGITLPVVMVGQVFRELDDYDRLIYTGFVSDQEKRAILQHSTLLINPSKYESLSLILLEALNDGVPVLVNGRCSVLKEHCLRSGGAVRYYTDEKSFCGNLLAILSDPEVRVGMSEGGRKYFESNYSWNKIMPRLEQAIKYVSADNSRY